MAPREAGAAWVPVDGEHGATACPAKALKDMLAQPAEEATSQGPKADILNDLNALPEELLEQVKTLGAGAQLTAADV